MPRKTIKVKELIEIVNHRNRESTCDPKVREGWNALLDEVLHRTDTYAGFNYLESDQVPGNSKPGIATKYVDKVTGKIVPCFPDETRIKYFTHKSLKG